MRCMPLTASHGWLHQSQLAWPNARIGSGGVSTGPKSRPAVESSCPRGPRAPERLGEPEDPMAIGMSAGVVFTA